MKNRLHPSLLPVSRVTKLAVLFAVFGALGVAAYGYWLFHTSDGELTGKPIWAMLQGRAMDDSTNRRVGPLLYEENGYVALGVPGLGAAIEDQGSGPSSTRMWIVLNEHSSTRALRQINSFPRYDLSCAYVSRLGTGVRDADDYVVAYLRTICS